MLRIWFFWTPHLAARVLRDFIEASDFEVAFVVTGEDKAIGRHQVVTPNEVKTLATEHDIPVLQPRKIRGNTEFFDEIRSYEADYFVVVAYGKIVPSEVLTAPKKRCLNIHGSILPKYRGASPIQSALLEWERETWVTIMCMSEGMDEWDIIDILRFPIGEGETSGSLFEKFAAVSGKFAIETIRRFDVGELIPQPQDDSLATYCSKIEKEDGLIDWSLDAKDIYHRWQGFTPWPGIFTTYEGKRLVIEECVPHPSTSPLTPLLKGEGNNTPLPLLGEGAGGWGVVKEGLWVKTSTILRLADKSVAVVCGKWILTLRRLKLEWKKSQSIEEFVNGQRGFVGSVLWE